MNIIGFEWFLYVSVPKEVRKCKKLHAGTHEKSVLVYSPKT